MVLEDSNIYEKTAELVRQNKSFAIVTIIEARGSTPRHAGKMLVLPDRTCFGTVGGGAPEYFTVEEAVKAISAGASKIVEYVLDADRGGLMMHCGGDMKLFIEVVAARPVLVLVGAGHVGYALAGLGERLGYEIRVADDREGYAAERYPNASAVYVKPSIADAVREARSAGEFTKDTYVVIATKDSDLEALAAAIDSPAGYIGMIGSRKKVAFIMRELRKRGIAEEKRNRVYAPVGLDIGSETPEEIAVSIMSEILAVKNDRCGGHLRDKCEKSL